MGAGPALLCFRGGEEVAVAGPRMVGPPGVVVPGVPGAAGVGGTVGKAGTLGPARWTCTSGHSLYTLGLDQLT